jgi:hypothetical protein
MITHNITTLSFIPESEDQEFTLIVNMSTGGQLILQGENVLGLYFHFVDLLTDDIEEEYEEE